MFQAPAPDPDTLPSSGALLRSTVVALAIAIVLLVTVVLPAEYGVDPTGVGQVIGLKRMGEIKMALALEAEADAAADAAALATEREAAENFDPSSQAASPETGSGEAGANVQMAEVVLQPNEGKEVKLAMLEGASVRYEWWTLGGGVNFDTHADQASGSVHSYSKGTARTSDEGVLTAAFDGMHGWYWRNRTTEEVTITLRVEGDFQELREMQ
jgi:hypothetical protein